MAVNHGKLVKGTLSLVKDRLYLPLGAKELNVPFGSFITARDLTQFLISQGATNVTLTNLEGVLYHENSLISTLKNAPLYLYLDNYLYKIIPSSTICHFSTLEFYDSLNIPSKDRHLLELSVRNLNKIFKPTNNFDKNQLINEINEQVIPGKCNYYENTRKFKELSFAHHELLEDYLKLKIIGDKYAKKMLWAGWFIATSQWAYIGIGTYVYFSWDIMEPQAYVINLGNAILLYIAFLLNKQEMTRSSIFNILSYKKISKLSNLHGFDLKKYEEVSKQLKELKSKI